MCGAQKFEVFGARMPLERISMQKRILDGVLRFVLFQEEVGHDLDQALHYPVLLQVFAELLPFQANGVLFDQEEILVGL